MNVQRKSIFLASRRADARADRKPAGDRVSGRKKIRDPKAEFEQIVTLIIQERRRRSFEAVRSLWRIGDSVRRLKAIAETGRWRRTLEECAARVGVHVGSLAEAARAAEAFKSSERNALRVRFERAGAELTPSHVIELTRASGPQRARGVEALLQNAYSIRGLRAYLRRRTV
jgi:hypothetical protein